MEPPVLSPEEEPDGRAHEGRTDESEEHEYEGVVYVLRGHDAFVWVYFVGYGGRGDVVAAEQDVVRDYGTGGADGLGGGRERRGGPPGEVVGCIAGGGEEGAGVGFEVREDGGHGDGVYMMVVAVMCSSGMEIRLSRLNLDSAGISLEYPAKRALLQMRGQSHSPHNSKCMRQKLQSI